ncbi:MAG: ribosomal protein L29 [Hyphomicrobiaceae bacterium]|jgi:ribosomal protein L29
MQAEDVRKLDGTELAAKELELRESVARLGLKRFARRLDKSHQLAETKKDLARVLTIRAERASVASGGAST